MKWRGGDRRGVALATALFALIAIALLVRAIVVPSLAGRRTAARVSRYHALETAVEKRLAALAGGATREDLVAMTPGRPAVAQEVDSAGNRLASELVRLSPDVWAVVVDGSIDLSPAAAVSRSVLIELRPDSAAPAAVMTAGGGASLRPGTVVDADSACGAPPPLVVPPDPKATHPATYQTPAGLRVAEARQAPSVRLPGGAEIHPAPAEAAGSCVAAPDNWGSPTGGPCHGRRPVVAAAGDLTITGGEGQGVLLIDGTLRIAGPFRFDGVIVAAGGILVTGADVHIAGAVFTSPSGAVSVTGDRVRFRGSGCVVREALLAAARPAVVREHGWFR